MPLTSEEFSTRYRALAAQRGRVVGELSPELIAKLQLGQARALGNYERALESALAGPPAKAGDTSRLERLISEARYLTGTDAALVP